MSKHRHIWHEPVDHENVFSDLITQQIPKAIASQINCISIGRIAHYNHAKHTCDVQLLPRELDGSKVAMITDVIVPRSLYSQDAFNRRIAEKLSIKYNKLLKVGSVVTIGFFDRELDNFHGDGRTYKVETDRMHSLNDATLLGVVQ